MPAAPKQHGPVRLEWHELPSGLEWHAGGLSRSFAITKNGIGEFVLRVRTGDQEPIRCGVFTALLTAKFRAQRILDQAQ